MMRRGEGTVLQKDPLFPLQAAGAVRSSRSQGFPMRAPNRLRMSAVRADQSLPDRWGDEALQTAQAEKVGIPGIEKRTGDEKERSTLLRRLVITRHLTNKTSFSFPLKTAVPCSQRNQQLGAK